MTHGVPDKMRSRFARCSPLASLLALLALGALGACSSVIGIEDLHQGPAPGSAGSNNGGSHSGGSHSGGDNGVGGDLVNPSGGANAMTGGAAGKGQGGGNGGSTAGNGTVGDAGAGASVGAAGAGSGDTTVHGHVIDFWGHRIPGVPVQIGEVVATTDEQGAFTVENVTAQYDASLVMDFSDDFRRQTYGWVFQGLTRRDPTLQVYEGLARHIGNVDVTIANEVTNATRTLTWALGGTDGSDEHAQEDLTQIQTSTNWRGPVMTQETAHALLWQFNATTSLPTGYVGYGSQSVALQDSSAHTTITLDVKAPTIPIPSGNIVGTVTPATSLDRANNVYLRFTSGAKIQLVNDTPGPANFSYLVPTIPNANVTFAAIEGDPYSGNYGVIHKDGLAAGPTMIAATIPTPSKPSIPTDGALNIGTDSQFSLLPGAGSAGAFVVSIISAELYDGLYIVTANKQFKLPQVAGGAYVLVAGNHYDWRVETHGALATVDAMAGPTGFMDEFSAGDNANVEAKGDPKGPRASNGSYTISYSNRFTAK